MTTLWKKHTWRNYPIAQQPRWPSKKAIKNILDEIESLPALVYAGETRTLL
jgi:3-deoxy-7-phosphoheptulonate synthase